MIKHVAVCFTCEGEDYAAFKDGVWFHPIKWVEYDTHAFCTPKCLIAYTGTSTPSIRERNERAKSSNTTKN